MRSGTSGVRVVASRATKPASSASEIAPRTSVRAAPQPLSLASRSCRRASISAPVISTAPRTSAPRAQADARLRSSSRSGEAAVATPIGRLTKKIQCQLIAWVIDAAGEQPDRGARGGDEAVDADRLRLLPRLGEHRHDHAEDHGGGQRAADALDEARADQHLLALREAAQQRGDREHARARPGRRPCARPGRRAARPAAAARRRRSGRRSSPRRGSTARSRGRPGSPAARRSRSVGRG